MPYAEITAIFKLGLACFKNLKDLNKLFADSILVEILEQLGDIEYSAALWSLESVSQSKDSKSQVWEAIGHFRSSYNSFYKLTKQKRFMGLLSTKPGKRVKGYDSAIKSLLFMALSYRFLDEKQNAKNVLDMIVPIIPYYKTALRDEVYKSQKVRLAGVGSMAAQGMSTHDEYNDVDEEFDRAFKSIDEKISAVEMYLEGMQNSLLPKLNSTDS